MQFRNADKKEIDALIAQHRKAQWTRQRSQFADGSRRWEDFKADGELIFTIESEGNYATVLVPIKA